MHIRQITFPAATIGCDQPLRKQEILWTDDALMLVNRIELREDIIVRFALVG